MSRMTALVLAVLGSLYLPGQDVFANYLRSGKASPAKKARVTLKGVADNPGVAEL